MDIVLMDVLKMINRITSGLTIESFIRKDRDISTEKIQQKDSFAIQAAQVKLSAEASDKAFSPEYPLTKRGIEQEMQKGHPKEAAYAIYLLNKLITHNGQEAEILFYSFGDWKDHMVFGLTPSEYHHELEMAGKEEDLSVYYENCINYFKTVNTLYKIGQVSKKK